MSVKPEGAVPFIRSRSHGSSSALVLPSVRPAVQEINELRLGRFSMNGGGQAIGFHLAFFFLKMRRKQSHSANERKNDQRLRLAKCIKLIHETNSGALERVLELSHVNKIVGRPPIRLSSSLPSTLWAGACSQGTLLGRSVL